MKVLLAVFVVVLLVAGNIEHQQRMAVEADLASAQADNAALDQQLDDSETSLALTAQKRLEAESAIEQTAKAKTDELAGLKSKLSDATKERDGIKAELYVAKADLADTSKKLMAESKQTCPTEAVVKERDETIANLEKQLADLQPKKAAPPKQTKLEAAMDDAANSSKLVAAVFGADDCKYCRSFEGRVLAKPALLDAIGEEFVLCQLNIDHDDIGSVKVHRTPAVGIYSPTEKKWLRFFTPEQTVDGFVRQLHGDGEESSDWQESDGYRSGFRRW